MATGEEFSLEKIQISGATLASLLQRFSTSSGHVEGFLFGHVSHLSPPQFSDSDPGPTEPSPISIVTVTSFLSAPATSPLPPATSSDLIGWFSGRRRSPLRPSLREAQLTSSLPSRCFVFLLLASPAPSPNDGTATIDTHEYRAYQFYRGGSKFVPKTLEAVNIGPEFRNHYGAFAPTSPFPALPVDFRGGSSSMAVDRKRNSDGKRESDGVGEKGMGVDVGVLSGLMGREAAEYTERLEDVYKGMLERLDQLAVLVHDSSAKVFHQENHNMKLRFKIAGLE